MKWADKDLEKKYPDVCYADPDPSVKTVFVITVTPATYHGTRVETNTNTTPTSGTVTDQDGNTATYQGTATTTTSTAVPYSFEYGKFMLTVETFGDDGKPIVRQRFQQNGIYHTMYGIPLGGRGHHPAKALIEDAVKWIHTGGLDDSLQSTRYTRDPGRPKPTKRGKCYGENHRAPTDETIDGKWLVRGMIKLTQTEHFVDVECLGR